MTPSAEEQLIEALPDAALLIGADGLVSAANGPAEAMLERSPVGSPVAALLIDAGGVLALAGPDGRLADVEVHLAELADGRRLLTARDVGIARRTASQLADAEQIAGVAVWEWHVPTDTVSWSREAYRLFDKPETIQPTYELWLAAIHPEDREWVSDYVEAAFQNHEDYDFEHRILRSDGTVRHLHCRGQVNLDADGQPLRLVGASQDITERVHQRGALAGAAARQEALLNAAGEGICGLDPEGTVTFANPAAAGLLSMEVEHLVGSVLGHRIIGREGDDDPLTHAIANGRTLEDQRATMRGGDGEELQISYHCSPIWTDDSVEGAVVTFADARERIRYEKRLRFLADHDSLTGLFNRGRFESETAAQVVYAERYGGTFAVLLLDLDHFKDVNDVQGHGSGDALIRSVARNLEVVLPPGGVLARLGGDEFAVLLPAADEATAIQAGEQLRRTVAEHAVLAGGERLQVTASIGVAVHDGGGGAPDEMLADADVAMYDAKDAGRNRVTMYRPELGARARMEARLAWSTRLREALDQDGFELYAQPIEALVPDVGERRFEILLRLPQPDGSVAMPAEFLPVAERHGLIREIDRWVVAKAAEIAARHTGAGVPLRLEVNLSGQSMVDSSLPAYIADLLSTSGAAPWQLIFEVTETAAIDSLHEARALAEGLVELGCEFAIDDFGAGFGSFAYLKHLPSQYVKIDGDFIRRLPTSPNDQLVVQAIAKIAAGMGKRTIAEFVETEETLSLLEEYGIDFAQGYYLGRPGPVEEVLAAKGVVRRLRPAL